MNFSVNNAQDQGFRYYFLNDDSQELNIQVKNEAILDYMIQGLEYLVFQWISVV